MSTYTNTRLTFSAKTPEKFYDLKGQIQHKLAFIRENIAEDCKVILAGRSIGAYIILHMLEELPSTSVLKCLLLFPTVERMALTDQGRFHTPVLQYLRWLCPLVIYPVSFFPDSLVEPVLRWHFKGRDIPECIIKATKELVSSSAISVITNMANEEMQTVVEANHDIFETHLKKLWFYYGSCDHWCPVEYYEDMKAKYPSGEIHLCTKGYEHAFVLEASEGMANISWEYLSENVLAGSEK